MYSRLLHIQHQAAVGQSNSADARSSGETGDTSGGTGCVHLVIRQVMAVFSTTYVFAQLHLARHKRHDYGRVDQDYCKQCFVVVDKRVMQRVGATARQQQITRCCGLWMAGALLASSRQHSATSADLQAPLKTQRAPAGAACGIGGGGLVTWVGTLVYNCHP